MPINGRRINELAVTSGAVLESDDYILVADSVAGGYTNKKISICELTKYLATNDTEPYIPLSGSSDIAGDLIPSASGTYDLGSADKSFNQIYAQYLKLGLSGESLTYPIEIEGNSHDDTSIQQTVYDNDGFGSSIIQKSARGTKDSPATLQEDDIAGSFEAYGYESDTGDWGYMGGISILALSGITSTDHGARMLIQVPRAGEIFPFTVFIVDSPDTSVYTNLIPGVDDSYELGNSTFNWDNLYVTSATINDQTFFIDTSGQIFVNGTLFQSGTDFTEISGYSDVQSQFFVNTSGDIKWEESIDGSLIYASREDLDYVSGQLSGLLDNTLTEYENVSGALTIDLSGVGAYEYILNGDALFTAIGAEANTSKFATSILSASFTVPSVSASFDPTWYWVGDRPTNNIINITSGNMVEVVIRSSGTKIIAAYEDLV